MIRKYNYTGRLKIPKDAITINQITSSGVKSFDVSFKFASLGFPGHARVYVEPYFKSSFMRFDFGNILRLNKPLETLLADIPVSDRILYRVKVVDETSRQGLILGYADELIPITDDTSGGKKPLLPVDFNDIGKRVWKLDFRDEGPILVVNFEDNIPKINEMVSTDSKFFSLVYPEVVRQVAFKIASDDEFNFYDPGTGWESMWLSYFHDHLSIIHVPETKEFIDCEEWSDDVSEAFCRKYNVINLLTDQRENKSIK